VQVEGAKVFSVLQEGNQFFFYPTISCLPVKHAWLSFGRANYLALAYVVAPLQTH
jgi:hypothetical protein